MVVALSLLRLLRSLQRGVRPIIPLLLLIAYTALGAIVFKAIEQPREIDQLKKLQIYRADQLDDTVFALNRVQRRGSEKVFNLTLKILRRYEKRLGLVDPEKVQPTWDIWGAILFVFTVYTTIGYGSVCPVTAVGRILTILVAFIGIPLALIALFALGGVFARLCKHFWSLMSRVTRCFSSNTEKRVDRPAVKGKEDDLLSFPVSLLILLTIAWVFLCAWIFTQFEDHWDYETSLYFTLISFTTIGFGDVVPKNAKYMIPIGLLLLIGLALVSTVFNIIQQQIEALSQGVEEKIDEDWQESDMITEEEIKGDGSRENKEFSTPSKSASKKVSLNTVVRGMPLRKQMLFKMMPDSSKDTLKAYCKKKAAMTTAACQTDPIPKKITYRNPRIKRSKDDINDLLLMSFWD